MGADPGQDEARGSLLTTRETERTHASFSLQSIWPSVGYKIGFIIRCRYWVWFPTVSQSILSNTRTNSPTIGYMFDEGLERLETGRLRKDMRLFCFHIWVKRTHGTRA